jgi:hypothetical protein
MGRNVSVYGIDHDALRAGLAARLARPEDRALLAACAAGRGVDGDELVRRATTDPWTMRLEELDVVIRAYDDLGELAARFDEAERRGEIPGLGIREVLDVATTNASGVFMEIFHEHFPEPPSQLAEADDGRYRLSREQWRGVLERVVAVTRLLLARDAGETYAADFPVDPALEAYAAGVHAEQVAIRTWSPETYGGKWGRDYFEFAWFCPMHADLHRDAGAHDEFVLIDSY